MRKTDPLLTADLSSIAKGFAVDALSELLTTLGAPHHLVQIGGDVKAAGHGADGS
ncbi:MAG: FAD:protein FMN transferase [Verrucomicrobiota bacterium]